MMGMASGMAMDGFKPIVYSITPFILFRPFEFIRNFLNEDGLPVKIVGVGRDEDYGALGFTHFANDDGIIRDSFTNIKIYRPENEEDLDLNNFINYEKPAYLNLRR
jgi:transketolase